jgi:hypothetical protein
VQRANEFRPPVEGPARGLPAQQRRVVSVAHHRGDLGGVGDTHDRRPVEACAVGVERRPVHRPIASAARPCRARCSSVTRLASATAGAEHVSVRAARRRVDDPLPGRRLHKLAQHDYKPKDRRLNPLSTGTRDWSRLRSTTKSPTEVGSREGSRMGAASLTNRGPASVVTRLSLPGAVGCLDRSGAPPRRGHDTERYSARRRSRSNSEPAGRRRNAYQSSLPSREICVP